MVLVRNGSLLVVVALLGGLVDVARADDELVDVAKLAPRARVELRYATPNNFLHEVLYESPTCLLRRQTAKRVASVQAELEKLGYGLLLWDCYRPLSVQQKMWDKVHDARYVARPEKGSRHNRGAAVDLTLVDERGVPLEMPTDFDDFSPRAHRNARASPAAMEHRALLEREMRRAGFSPMPTEWWHFDDPAWRSYAPR